MHIRRGFYFDLVKKTILPSLLATVFIFIALRWQGITLVTPQSPRGIVDLEFAQTTEHLRQMLLFWNTKDVEYNIYLYFLFIVSYVWFLSSTVKTIKEYHDWTRAGDFFYRLCFFSGMLDVLENLLILDVVSSAGRETTLKIIYFIAAAKFLFSGIILVYILVSLFIIFRKMRRRPN